MKNSPRLMAVVIILISIKLGQADEPKCEADSCRAEWQQKIMYGGRGNQGPDSVFEAFLTKCTCVLKETNIAGGVARYHAELSEYKAAQIQITKDKETALAAKNEKFRINDALEKQKTDCKADGYSTCYGLKWGTTVTTELIGTNESYSVSTDDVAKVCAGSPGGTSLANDFLENCGTQLKEASVIMGFQAGCAMIVAGAWYDEAILDPKLSEMQIYQAKRKVKGRASFVGAARSLPEMIEPEIMLVKSDLRKKYGDPVKTGECETEGYGATYYQYKGKNGLEVVLNILKQSDDKSGVVIRYLHVPALEAAKKRLADDLAREAKASKKGGLNSVKNAVKDL